jgi:hypothetical protein
MQLVSGLSSLFFIVSALNSIKTQNNLWIFSNFYIIYTSFMYNIHKFDLYDSFPLLENSNIDLSDKYDKYLFNDYIAVSLIAFVKIDNLVLKNLIFVLFFIEYYNSKSIVHSKNIAFFTSILNVLIKLFKNYKNDLISYNTAFSIILNLINSIIIISIRYRYYLREKQIENVILTALWHYYIVNVLYNVSYCMFIETNNNHDNL